MKTVVSGTPMSGKANERVTGTINGSTNNIVSSLVTKSRLGGNTTGRRDKNEAEWLIHPVQPNNKTAEREKEWADPVILIALAVALGKQGGLSAVPDPILVPLVSAASHGCGASRMVIEWLERRSLLSVVCCLWP